MPTQKPAAPVKSQSAATPPVSPKPAANGPVANTNTPPALKLADVQTMPQSERIALFVRKDVAAGRIFIDLGKLFTGIEADLAKGEQIYPLLMKAGVRKGSVSNASQTSRVFKELVVSKVISETVFDGFTWGDINALNRVMSGASKRKLSAEEAAKIVTARPTDFDEELESIFATGLTMKEANKAAKAQAAEEKKAQADKIEADKQAAAAKAAADALAKKAAADKAAADKAAAEAKTSADKAKAAAAQKKADADAKAALAAQKKADEDAAAAQAQADADAKAAAKKITPMPPAAVTLTDCGELLDKLIEMVSKLTVKQQTVFYSTTWKAAGDLIADGISAATSKAA